MLQLGEIIGVTESRNVVTVKDIFTKSIFDSLPLDNIIQIQYQPVIGDIVLFINIDDKILKIIKVWNVTNNNLIRQGDYPLQQGELQLMGIMGQYMYLDNVGSKIGRAHV